MYSSTKLFDLFALVYARKSKRLALLQRAGLLSSRVPHNGDWLLSTHAVVRGKDAHIMRSCNCRVLAAEACGLKLDDEAVRVAVALPLRIDVGKAHVCSCGATVNRLMQTAVLSSRSAVASPSHGMLRKTTRWRIPMYKLLPGNLVQSPSCLPPEKRPNTQC